MPQLKRSVSQKSTSQPRENTSQLVCNTAHSICHTPHTKCHTPHTICNTAHDICNIVGSQTDATKSVIHNDQYIINHQKKKVNTRQVNQSRYPRANL